MKLNEEIQALIEDNYSYPKITKDTLQRWKEQYQALEEKMVSNEQSQANVIKGYQDRNDRLFNELKKLSKATRENTKHLSDEEVIAMYGKETAEIIWMN